MKKFMSTLRLFLWLTLLTGIIYPFAITGVAKLTMKKKASGNLILSNGKIIGATLIAQKFESNKYFWPRPSFNDYQPLHSGASNLGPTSKTLKRQVDDRRKKLQQSHPVDKEKIPADLLFASGSGLDPHISLEAAYFQVDRVAKSRGIENSKVKKLVDSMVIHRTLGFLGEECVNVLLLNRALDESSVF